MKQVLLLFFLPVFSFGQQLSGKVIDKENNELLPGVRITTSEGNRATTNEKGEFTIEYSRFPLELISSFSEYLNDTLRITAPGYINILLKPELKQIETVVVTASRRGQNIEDVSISMEVLKPALIENKAISNIEQALDQSPGVYAMDGQISIRGGSGFSYGAGTRVMMLWNDMPMISADAGDVKWNTVPLELSSKIEVIKGASSVLYGSGALNGIVAVSEIEPTRKQYVKARIQGGFYDNPRRASLRLNNTSFFQLVEAATGQRKGQVGYNLSVNAFNDQGYRFGEKELRGRVSGSVFYIPRKINGLKTGIGYSVFYQQVGSFIVWENDSLAYTPQGGADISVPGSSLSVVKGLRLNIDPYIRYVDNKGNSHQLKTRYYLVNNQSVSNSAQSSSAETYFADYIYQKKWDNGFILNTGATLNSSVVKSKLYNDHHSNNVSVYAQAEKKIGNLDITAGVRFEYFDQDGKKGDSDFYLNRDSTKKIPFYPIFRAAAHYKLFKYTHLRASFGQGVRYPAISERYTQTSVGALNIFPNNHLKRETGWAAEIGIKQGVKIGDWKGLIDIAGFINQYNNMMEFTFGLYSPKGVTLSIDPNHPYYIGKWIGFQAQNAEKARITGIETSFSSEGNIGDVTIRSLIGYTYMNPVSVNTDSAYRATFSDTSSNLLKYRFRHLAKADVEVEYKKISLGFSIRYNSYMKNIDRVFEDPIILNTYILPGLKNYRREHQTGSLFFDIRAGYDINEHYRVGIVVNNLFNSEYMGRPGDILPPRSFIAQFQLKF